MRVFLDEMLPWRLKRSLEHEVHTASDMGWNGIKNGELLKLVEQEFAVMLTTDKSFSKQNHLPGVGVAVILLRARSNGIDDLLPLMDEARRALPLAQPGRVHVIGTPPGRRRR